MLLKLSSTVGTSLRVSLGGDQAEVGCWGSGGPWCAEKTSALFELHFEFSSSYVSVFSFYTHIWADWNLLFELQLRFSSLYMPVFTVWIAVFFYAYLGRMEIFEPGPKCCSSYVSVCSGLHWLVLHSEIFELHLEFSSCIVYKFDAFWWTTCKRISTGPMQCTVCILESYLLVYLLKLIRRGE